MCWVWRVLCVCAHCTCACTAVCGVEGKEEEGAVKFQRSARTGEQSGDEGGLLVTSLQRKPNQCCSQSHQQWKVVYKCSFLSSSGAQAFLQRSQWKISLVLRGTLPVYLSLGAVLGQKGLWHLTSVTFFWCLMKLSQTTSNHKLGVCKCIQLWVGDKCPVPDFSYIQQ